jgi:hypothetical protein
MPKTHNPEHKVAGSQEPTYTKERRRTKRLRLSFQIEVSGRDRAGHLFHDAAVTIDVNDDGCQFDLVRQLQRGDVVGIRVVGRGGKMGKLALFEVVWAEASERGWTIGAMKLQAVNIWNMHFPRTS